MKTINLEQILKNHIGEYSKSPISPLIINAMREACNQAIDLCAEKQAKAYSEIGLTSTASRINDLILNTKNQIL